MPGLQLALQSGPAERPLPEQLPRLGDDGRDVLPAQALTPRRRRERPVEHGLQQRAERQRVGRRHRVDRRPHQLGADHLPRRHQAVQLGRVVAGQPVPERQVRHQRHLRPAARRGARACPRPVGARAPAAAAGRASPGPAPGSRERRSELDAAGQRAVDDEVRAGGAAGHRAGQEHDRPARSPPACPCARSGSAPWPWSRGPGSPARSAARPRRRSRCCRARRRWPAPRARPAGRPAPRCSRRSPSSWSRRARRRSPPRGRRRWRWRRSTRCRSPPGAAAPPATSRTVCMRSTSKDVYQFSSVSGMASALTLATTASIPPSRSAAAPTHAATRRRPATSSRTPRTGARGRPAPSRSRSISPASRAQNSTTAPSSSERLDDRPADAAGAAGDEHARAGELQVHGRSPSSDSERVAARRRRSACSPP